jgi:hypothetical protein
MIRNITVHLYPKGLEWAVEILPEAASDVTSSYFIRITDRYNEL